MKDITLNPDIKSFEDVKNIFIDHINRALGEVSIHNTVHGILIEFRDYYVKDWGDFRDVFWYFDNIEIVSDASSFIAWLYEYKIIDYTVDWYKKFSKSVTVGAERIRFYSAMIKEFDKEITRRRYNFDDDDMGILEI